MVRNMDLGTERVNEQLVIGRPRDTRSLPIREPRERGILPE